MPRVRQHNELLLDSFAKIVIEAQVTLPCSLLALQTAERNGPFAELLFGLKLDCLDVRPL